MPCMSLRGLDPITNTRLYYLALHDFHGRIFCMTNASVGLICGEDFLLENDPDERVLLGDRPLRQRAVRFM